MYPDSISLSSFSPRVKILPEIECKKSLARQCFWSAALNLKSILIAYLDGTEEDTLTSLTLA